MQHEFSRCLSIIREVMFQEITQHVQLFSMDINEDHEHARRGTKHSNTQVDFSESTKFRIKQYIFP